VHRLYHYLVHQLSKSVLSYIRKQNLLRPGDRAGVAVSGGADSVALLRVLLELRAELGLVLSVVHLNHCLRGAESDGDEQFVREFAAHHDLPFFSVRRDVSTYATEKKLSVETAARELRYQYFEELLRKGEFNKLATAHTLDDQAETVLLRLLRGSGLRGLSAIRPRLLVKDVAEQVCGAIIRPLLSTRRAQAAVYLAELGQKWHDDATNRNLQYTRNRVRHVLVPLLQKEFNPAATEKLSELAEIARGEEEFWDQERNRLFGSVVSLKRPAWLPTPFYVSSAPAQDGPKSETIDPLPLQKLKQPWPSISDFALNLERFRALPLGAQRRLLQSLESFGMPLDFLHMDRLVRLASSDENPESEIRLPGGWRAVRTAKELLIFTPDLRTEDRIACDYEYPFEVPGSVAVWENGIVLDAQFTSADERYNPDHLLDRRFADNLLVRNWRAGDRFWPANSKQPKKIKELLQDRHITGDEKKAWPVIASGEEIVWLRGFGVRQDLQTQNGAGILITEKALDSGLYPETGN
jgi:tRNA(Ile)-lysidine synthase